MINQDKPFFYLYLSSGDINPYSQNNTPTNFTTPLATPLNLPRGKGWRVAISQLSISNNIEGASNFIKVKTSLIQPEFNQEKTLAVLTKGSGLRQDPFCHFEPTKREFYNLGTSHLANIDITLTDADDQQLIVPFSQPTLVILEFRRMKDSEFIIRFDSAKDSKGNGANFAGKIPSTVSSNPNQKWEVSLNSLIHTGDFKQIPPFEGDTVMFLTRFDCKREREVEAEFDINDVPEEGSEPLPKKKKILEYETCEVYSKMKGRRIKNNISLFRRVEKVLNQIRFKDDDMESSQQLFRYVRLASNKLTFEVQRTCSMSIPFGWAMVLGSGRAPGEDGNVIYTFESGKLHEFEKPINYKAWLPHYMLLYANFIEYSPFGSYFVPILRAIPIHFGSDKKTYYFYETTKDEFHPVTFSQIQDVQFRLHTIDGRSIEFTYPDARVILSLKFRRVE